MKIGTIKKIEIKLHFSTLFIIFLVGLYAATFYSSLIPEAPLWELLIVGILNGVIMLFSILIHELMHSIYAQKYGLKVSEIELYLFGGVSKIEEEPKTPRTEFIIAGVGPASSLALGAIFLVLFYLPINYPAFILVTLFYSGFSNIGLGIFNLLPAFPMDGGRVLRSYLWKKRNNLLSATKTASKVGTFFGYGFIVYGFIQVLFGSLGGFWMVLIGMFLNNASKRAYIQTSIHVWLSQFSAKEISDLPEVAIHFDTILEDAIRHYFMRYKRSFFPVIKGYDIVGILHIQDIKNVPLEKRQEIIVGYVMKKLSEFSSITAEESGTNAVKKLYQIEKKPNILIVRDGEDDRIIGFISEEQVKNALKFAEIGLYR